MNLIQVRYVLAVAKFHNFSKAADYLYLTQPALSLQISKLERELGFPLFYRTSKGVFLTEVGEEFCEKATPLIEAWSVLQSTMECRKNSLSGSLRIGVGPRVYSNHLFGNLVSFFDQYPKMDVTFISNINVDSLEALRKGEMDVALDRMPPRNLISDPEQFIARELVSERCCLLISQDDPAGKRLDFHFREIQGYTVITGPKNSIEDRIIMQNCKKYGVAVIRPYRSDNIDTVMSLVRERRGVAIGPQSFADYYGVSAVPLLPETFVSLCMIYLKKKRNDPKIKLLRNYLAGKSCDCSWTDRHGS